MCYVSALGNYGMQWGWSINVVSEKALRDLREVFFTTGAQTTDVG